MSNLDRALEVAREAQAHAYCPFSKFPVGAAICVRGSDRIFAGCNVENSSYGASICAERNAILSMVAALGASEISDVVVVSRGDNPAVPCADCLQVIAEFAGKETTVHLANEAGFQKTFSISELLPHPFLFSKETGAKEEPW
jgi:homotetrameric cytidine deaminase